MASIREQIAANLAARLALAVKATFYRSRAVAISREESPALVMDFLAEDAEPLVHSYVDRRLLLRITGIVRADPPDAAIDVVMAEAHKILMVDPKHGGKAIDTTEVGRTWDIVAADKTAVIAETRYSILYRTKIDDEELGYP